MRGLLRRLGLAVYGGDELALAALACAVAAWALAVNLTPWLALAALPPWLVVVWFFRDPERASGAPPGALLAPADGTVTDVEEVDEPSYLGGRALRIGIFLSPLDVHVNRAPCAGRVEHLRYRVGEFLPAYAPAAPERNESQELGLVTAEGVKVMVKQISGILARRIVCEARQGLELCRGERYGMIKFGSRTELYVPGAAGYRPLVTPGAKVRGGETPILGAPPTS